MHRTHKSHRAERQAGSHRPPKPSRAELVHHCKHQRATRPSKLIIHGSPIRFKSGWFTTFILLNVMTNTLASATALPAVRNSNRDATASGETNHIENLVASVTVPATTQQLSVEATCRSALGVFANKVANYPRVLPFFQNVMGRVEKQVMREFKISNAC